MKCSSQSCCHSQTSPLVPWKPAWIPSSPFPQGPLSQYTRKPDGEAIIHALVTIIKTLLLAFETNEGDLEPDEVSMCQRKNPLGVAFSIINSLIHISFVCYLIEFILIFGCIIIFPGEMKMFVIPVKLSSFYCPSLSIEHETDIKRLQYGSHPLKLSKCPHHKGRMMDVRLFRN